MINMIELLVFSLTLTALVVGHPAPGHYLIETEDEDLKLPGDARDDSAEMEQVVEKGSKDVIDGEETDGEIIEKGKKREKKDYGIDEDYCPDDCEDPQTYEAPDTRWW